MNCLLFYNGKDPAFSIWDDNMDACMTLVRAMKRIGWKFVWTVHTSTGSWPLPRYEKEYEEWKKLE
jgi:hypothetical protein